MERRYARAEVVCKLEGAEIRKDPNAYFVKLDHGAMLEFSLDTVEDGPADFTVITLKVNGKSEGNNY